MSRLPLFTLFLLLSVSFASRPHLTPARERQVRQCLRKLRLAQKDLRCAMLRISLPKRIDEARKCRFNGLPFKEYQTLRAICRQRSNILEKVRKAERNCKLVTRFKGKGKPVKSGSGSSDEIPPGFDIEPKCKNLGKLKKLRSKTLRACKRIGWNKSRDCEHFGPLKRKLEWIKSENCGEDGVEEAEKEVQELRKRCERLGGSKRPKPSVVPRVSA